MIKIGRKFVWIFIFAISTYSSDTLSIIGKVNANIRLIDDSINSGYIPYIEIKDISTSEGSPAEFKVYYKNEQIRIIVVSVGHETWETEFRYYYDVNGKPMKYIKAIKGRDDKPSKQAIIYDKKGNEIWKNIDKTVIDPYEIYNLFSRLQQMRINFSEY